MIVYYLVVAVSLEEQSGGKGVAPMNEIMLIIALCNCVMNLIGLILKLYEIRQKNKSRS